MCPRWGRRRGSPQLYINAEWMGIGGGGSRKNNWNGIGGKEWVSVGDGVGLPEDGAIYGLPLNGFRFSIVVGRSDHIPWHDIISNHELVADRIMACASSDDILEKKKRKKKRKNPTID